MSQRGQRASFNGLVKGQRVKRLVLTADHASQILGTTQIRRLIAFASAGDMTIECFNESRQQSEVFS
jgi:hypothetical protein